jgi:hypothetical protein
MDMIEDDILKILWSESTIKLADSLLVDLAIDGGLQKWVLVNFL